MPLRILMMADTPADPDRGAAGTEVQTLRALRDLGHHVDAIWAGDLGRRIAHGNLHLLLELPHAYEREAVKALGRSPYDVFHVNQPHGYRAARAVHRLSPKSVFVHRSHGFEPHVEAALEPWRRSQNDSRKALRRIASNAVLPLVARHARLIVTEADGHLVSSTMDGAFLEERMGVSRERIAVIPQAAPDEYRLAPPWPMTTERLHRVLHVAQFAFFKAPWVTAEAINRMAASNAQVRFTWVCDRSSHEQIRALLAPPAAARTELLHWTTQTALRDIYDTHGLFLFPSLFEGFGKAFLEAMSRGLCVVASDTGGMHDLISHGRNGCLVPAGDAVALSDAALAILNDPERAARISDAASATAREYTWARVARECSDFYTRLLAARAKQQIA